MSITEQNYHIKSLPVLLDESCLSGRYYPLIPYRTVLTANLTAMGCLTKHDCGLLTDDELIQAGLDDSALVALFHRFLNLYDITTEKMKLIEKAGLSDEEKASYAQLFRLPGVRLTRAMLYRLCGYTDLYKIACTTAEDLITAAESAIAKNSLTVTPPRLKEAATHIAVANVFTEYEFL